MFAAGNLDLDINNIVPYPSVDGRSGRIPGIVALDKIVEASDFPLPKKDGGAIKDPVSVIGKNPGRFMSRRVESFPDNFAFVWVAHQVQLTTGGGSITAPQFLHVRMSSFS